MHTQEFDGLEEKPAVLSTERLFDLSVVICKLGRITLDSQRDILRIKLIEVSAPGSQKALHKW